MRVQLHIWLIVLAAMLIAIPLLSACGDDETGEPTATAPPTTTPASDEPATTAPAQTVKFKLGVITDITGPASQAMTVCDASLADLVRYYNENNLIPGLKLETIKYDSQYDPSKAMPAYHWLIERDADVILTGLPPIVSVIHTRCTQDEVPLLTIVVSSDAIVPPTWNFSFNTTSESFMYTLLKWVAENDPDFPQDRPAKIGGAGWEGPYMTQILDGMDKYCKAHPDQYELVDTFLASFTQMSWENEVDVLSECDYVVPPATGISTTQFMKEYVNAGGKGKFLGTDAHNAYLGMIVDTFGGWEKFDGMLFCLPNRWYNEEGHGEVVDLINQLLEEYHSTAEANNFRWAGSSYQGSFHQWWGILELIRATAEEYGPENVTRQAIYDTAVNFTRPMSGGQLISFSETDRTAWEYYGIYEASAEHQDLMRIGMDEWWPVRNEP